MIIYKCSDCAGGPCEWHTTYPIDEEGSKATQCPIDEHGVDSAVWIRQDTTQSDEEICEQFYHGCAIDGASCGAYGNENDKRCHYYK